MATLDLIYGCMFSGKTTKLISIYNLINKNYKCLAINYIYDNRYTNDDKIVSHNKNSIDCISIKNLDELALTNTYFDKFNNAEYIFINEAQFFPNLKKWVLYVKNTLNKNLILCGLDLDYKKEKFGELIELLPYTTTIYHMTGKCDKCENESLFTHRLVDNDNQVLIGLTEYIPVCKECWDNLNKY
mgnify:FL=1|tara:strand:- start:285 stop:842 length:558 start_codon:yes stop_codon:yes gene_type:complete